jgi:aryl-alcohol dehydrogenase-like predicted oxidoreductase
MLDRSGIAMRRGRGATKAGSRFPCVKRLFWLRFLQAKNRTKMSQTPESQVSRRQIGQSDLWISPVSLGCWPMAGISSLGVDDAQSEATIHAALDHGVNHFDTAYSYGYDGRSDRVLRRALRNCLDEVIIGSKVGTHYATDRTRIMDATPERLKRQADEIRFRLGIDRIDLLYLHCPDGVTPIENSAQALAELVDDGVVRYVGLSNASLDETYRFSSVIQPIVLQPPFNMLQQDTLEKLTPFLEEHRCGVACYWPLMKGLLAGAMGRDHVFDPDDKRLTYPIFQGEAWTKAHDLLDELRRIASDHGWTVARLVIHWTIRKRNITTVLCGAKRPAQIIESAMAMQGVISDETLQEIDRAIARCQSPNSAT